MSISSPERALAECIARLSIADIPAVVQARTEDLFLDWMGSTLAGKGSAAVETIAELARVMGPGAGPCEILIDRSRSSPLFAAMVNAAASHIAEQDDVHNGSVFHPATIVFPVALAVAQHLGRSGGEFIAAAVAGYDVGIRVGEFLGRSHYKIFHTTGTAGALAAAATAGHLLKLTPSAMLHALGSAGTQAAGLWEFLKDAADSKQLHTAHAAAAGLTAAYLASRGFKGAERILTGARGLGAGLSQETFPERLTDRLGERWPLLETSFKFHASCRHTHPAADALQQVLQQHGLTAVDVKSVTARVHQAAIDVLGPVTEPKSVHQSKFSMGTVLGLIAVLGRAGLVEFDAHYQHPAVADFRRKVRMVLDGEVDDAYPARWIGKVTVETVDGRRFDGRIDEPKGDPGNTLSRSELELKMFELGRYSNGATDAELRQLIALTWRLRKLERMPELLSHRQIYLTSEQRCQ